MTVFHNVASYSTSLSTIWHSFLICTYNCFTLYFDFLVILSSVRPLFTSQVLIIKTSAMCAVELIPKPSTTKKRNQFSDGVARTDLSAERNSFISGEMCTFFMCALFQPYPPTINFLECWMHLSDGSAKVVTLSHHGMRASNDCLREIAVSSNVFENISHPCLLFLYLLLTNTWKTFLLTYVISLWFSAAYSLVK